MDLERISHSSNGNIGYLKFLWYLMSSKSGKKYIGLLKSCGSDEDFEKEIEQGVKNFIENISEVVEELFEDFMNSTDSFKVKRGGCFVSENSYGTYWYPNEIYARLNHDDLDEDDIEWYDSLLWF